MGKFIIGILTAIVTFGGLFAKLKIDADEKEKLDALKAKEEQLSTAMQKLKKFEDKAKQEEIIAKKDKEVQVETIDNHDGTVTDKF